MSPKKITPVSSAARGPRGGRYEGNRSVRMSDDLWAAVQDKARSEGHTAGGAMKLLAEGYVRDAYQLPQMKMVYPTGSQK